MAISFAGPQRAQAEELANALRDAGLSVFLIALVASIT
jgi:hypothetical protein